LLWTEVTVSCPQEAIEAASEILLSAGSPGVRILPQGVVGWFPSNEELQPKLGEVERRLALFPQCGLPPIQQIQLKQAEDEDWANAWKQYYRPMEIGKRLVIKPTWETYQGDPNRVVVELDPGMAFGTGGHATTRLCLELLDECIRPGMTAADLGTGSGILALAAAKLGASVVHATDIDLLPRRIARENTAVNGLDGIVHIHEMDAFDTAAHNCDLLVANILAGTIVELLPTIVPRLKNGGIFIGSGIIDEKLDEVLAALSQNGLQLREVREEEAWRAVVAVKPA
jgi:ribosomal protein L11 methyltransferase